MKKVFLLLCILCITQVAKSQVFYNLSACAYTPVAGGGTAIPLCDDCMSGMIPIGFTFVFYGSPFTTLDVSSNGFLTFDPGMGNGCCSGQAMPVATWPTMIAFSWDDMYTTGGVVNYFTTGVAPNRRFILNYNNVGYCCTSSNMASVQVQLFETTNEIRILSANNIHAARTATMGIQMIGQGQTVVPGRNAAGWNAAANECQSFLPGVPPPPANDNPCGATALTVGVSCTYAPTTNISATNTAGVPAPGCAGYSGGDVWYTAVVPATGSITFDTQTGVMLDGGMAVYTAAACGGPFVLVACDDNNSPNGAMPMLSLTGQTPGTTLWIRVWENGNNNNGSFSICAYDPPPPLCYTATAIAYAPDAVGGTSLVMSDDQYSGAVNIGFTFCVDGTTHTQLLIASNGYLDFDLASAGAFSPYTIAAPIATTNPTEIQKTILGPWHDLYPPSGGTITYQTLGTAPNRRFVVTWQDVPMFSCTGLLDRQQIRLYESSNCIEMHLGNKPICAAWNTGQAIQGINNFNGTMAAVIPGRNAPTNWSATNDAYRLAPTCVPCLTAVVCSPPLPVEMQAMTAECNNGEVTIRWTTATEINNDYFTVEKSIDGIIFEALGVVDGAGNNNQLRHYTLNDNDARTGDNYYRIKQTDYNGQFEYYSVLSTTCLAAEINIYPNPNNGVFTLEGAEKNSNIEISDISGHIVYQMNLSSSKTNLDLSYLSKGIYLITIHSSKGTIVKKLVID